MEYSQRALLDACKTGNVSGEHTTPVHIETVISNVFVFPERTYKIYKNDNAFFNNGFRDISTKSERFAFTREDFTWNHNLSSGIYIELRGVCVKNGSVHNASDVTVAHELVIVSRTFSQASILLNIFDQAKLPTVDTHELGVSFGNFIQTLPDIVKHADGHIIFNEHINAVARWISEESAHFEKNEIEKNFTQLRAHISNNLVLQDSTRVVVSGMDVHSGNVVYENGQFSFFDTYPPVDIWFQNCQFVDFYRLGTDIRVFLGEPAFIDYKKGFESSTHTKIPPEVDYALTLIAALNMVSYLYNLGEPYINRAKKYHEFIKNMSHV